MVGSRNYYRVFEFFGLTRAIFLSIRDALRLKKRDATWKGMPPDTQKDDLILKKRDATWKGMPPPRAEPKISIFWKISIFLNIFGNSAFLDSQEKKNSKRFYKTSKFFNPKKYSKKAAEHRKVMEKPSDHRRMNTYRTVPHPISPYSKSSWHTPFNPKFDTLISTIKLTHSFQL